MSLFPLVKARMIFLLYIPVLLSHKEVFVKRIICIFSALALSGFTHQVIASNELCLASNNDCTFVLLSTKVSEKTSELVNQITSEEGGSLNEAKVVQASSYLEESEKLLLVNEKSKATFIAFLYL